MRIVVDSSVWSLALRRTPARVDAKVRQLHDLIRSGTDVFILGIIFQEVLQGVRSQEQFRRLQAVLQALPWLECDVAIHSLAAEIYTTGRRRGKQVGTIDALIAAACIRSDCYLLTADRDFLVISQLSPLKLI